MNTNAKAYSLSHKGRREYNQDACVVINEENLVLLAVADGMGGHNGGEEASRAVIDTCNQIITTLAKEEIDDSDLKRYLSEIFDQCQEKIKEIVIENPELTGMGTTLTCVLIHGDNYVWGNIGDSRVYHFNGSILKQLTVDHSYMHEYIEEFGNDVPDYVKAHSNIITRSISGGDDKPDIFPQGYNFETLEWDQGFLLCSDGLILDKSNDNDDWMAGILRTTPSLKDAAEELIKYAYQKGSNDNISVVIYEHYDFERQVDDEHQTMKFINVDQTEQQTAKNSGENTRKRNFPSRRVWKLIFWLSLVLILLAGAYILIAEFIQPDIPFFQNPLFNEVIDAGETIKLS